ncbi:probetacellulin isoform X3 [Pseudoliparis swirei]|uniref:probetacellulin isoform X3 n=1 Tax=Pseudoliparis swirei TaxID=2059687 RepID=UPI0024BD838E|nr:probetacellulin isoform X3 [Pseudoliparis swirei]
MAKVCGLYVGVVTEWNATDESANRTESLGHHHGNGDNCTVSPTDPIDTGQWTGHFSECPEELTHYCIHGDCRYIREQEAPSCRCQRGYIGSRCEYLDLDWRIGEKRQIVIVCIIAGLVLLVLLIVFMCFCSHRRCRLWRRRGRRREEEHRNGTEKLPMMDAGASHTTSRTGSTEAAHTDSV